VGWRIRLARQPLMMSMTNPSAAGVAAQPSFGYTAKGFTNALLCDPKPARDLALREAFAAQFHDLAYYRSDKVLERPAIPR
jgi:hypothetical protein